MAFGSDRFWKVLGRSAQKRQARSRTQVDRAAAHSAWASALSDTDIATAANELRVHTGSELDVPRYLALVREASSRSLGMTPFDVQLLAALRMLEGEVVEMATGEGKTLAGAMAAVGYVLSGRSVHVVSINDFLARRDAEWMGPMFGLLGIRVGSVSESSTLDERRAAYGSDVTYASVNEVGFDVLRDHLVDDAEDLVTATPDVALIDEADSVLVDEALVPLVAALAEVVLPPAAPGIEAGPPVPAGRRLAEALQALRAPSAPVVEAAARTGPTEVRTEVSRLISEISAQVAETPQAQAEPPLRGDRAVSQIPAGGATEMRQMAERPPVDLAPSRVELRAGVAAVPAPPAAAGAELRAPVIADMAAAPAPAPAQPGTVFTPAPPPEVVAQQARAPLPDSGQILGQLRAQVDQGGTIRVALRPEGLGRVEISLAPGDDGQISVTVRADQASVLGSLRADREGLLTLLRDAGHQVEARGLSFADMGSQGSGEGARQNTGQGARQTALPQTWAGETAAEPTDPPTPAAPASGGVDITV